MTASNHLEITIPLLSAVENQLRRSDINLFTFPVRSAHWRQQLAEGAELLEDNFQFWAINQSAQQLNRSLGDALVGLGRFPLGVTQELREDIVALTREFACLARCPRPFVSVRTVSSAYLQNNPDSVSTCFHRDCTALTLTTTYCGVGTQWVADTNIRREFFVGQWKASQAIASSEYLHHEDEIFTVPCGSIALLKGEITRDLLDSSTREFLLHFLAEDAIPTINPGGALIHRGPALTSTNPKRLVLTISSFSPY